MSASLLALLQLSDSAFPSGAFAHSYGLEQLVRERCLDAESILPYVKSSLRQSVATAEARACFAAAVAANKGDVETVIEFDRALLRSKVSAELRSASLQTGRRLVEETALHIDGVALEAYQRALSADAGLGNYAVAFGVVAAALDAEPAAAPAALMLASVNATLQAAMRLGCISHRDTQAVLHSLRPLIDEAARAIAAAEADRRLLAFQPLQEIGSMRHERAEARLFAS